MYRKIIQPTRYWRNSKSRNCIAASSSMNVEGYGIVEREDVSFLVDAQIPFYDFLSRFDKTEWMNEGEQEFDTLAGFILHELERIPHTGDKMEWRGFKFEIIDMCLLYTSDAADDRSSVVFGCRR